MTRFQTFTILDYTVDAAIEPKHNAPHVGADSPRYMEPGRPGRLLWCRVLNNRVDVTLELDLALLRSIERRVCMAEGIPFSGADGVLPPSHSAPSFSIREGGQQYIDWRRQEA